jgi:signal transduction histidine kinase
MLELDLTKMEENKLNLEIAPLDIRELVRDSFKIVSLSAAKKGLELYQEIEENVPQKILGDHSRLCKLLTQIMTNLFKVRF